MQNLLRVLFGFIVLTELLGTLLLATQWVPEMGWSRGLFYSFFHAVSAFNNAGFGLAANSLADYVGNPLINLVISFLFIAGGIGFAVIADLRTKRRFQDLTLHTKLMLVLFTLEYGNPDTLGALHGWGSKLWASWFQAVAPRSSGFSTMDTASLKPASAFFIMMLSEDGNFLDLAFEVVSAASTTGLSRGVTPTLSIAGQCTVMVLMLIGRVGPLTLAFTLANPRGASIAYPAGRVNIG